MPFQEGGDDVKAIVGRLSELRYRLTTNKTLTEVDSSRDDTKAWNERLEEWRRREGEGQQKGPSWFDSPWLYVECFMYRKIAEAFERSLYLKDWDPFMFQKEKAFIGAEKAMTVLGDYLGENLSQDLASKPVESLGKLLKELIQVDDLEIVCSELLALRKRDTSSGPRVISFVMDNAGLELFSDLLLADFLLEVKLADQIVFWIKAMPWFVSDTTGKDFSWTLEMLKASSVPSLQKLGNRWIEFEAEGKFQLEIHQFWTLPHAFHEMPSVDPQLHARLQTSAFTFFKGDLNYRKLTEDRTWPTDTPFTTSLQGFRPGPMVALRTLKADVVTGLKAGQAEAISKSRDGTINWMTTGEFAVIQYDSPNL